MENDEEIELKEELKKRKIIHKTTTLVDETIKGKDEILIKSIPNIIKSIKNHIESLSSSMATAGPEKRPLFTKNEERRFIDATGIHFDSVTKAIKDCKMISKDFLTQTNEFYILISILISFYYNKKSIINKIEFAKILNLYLALRIYKAAFGAFFKYYTPNKEVMDATIERLNSNRYNLKKYKTIYNTIVYIADSHYENFESLLKEPIDDNITYYIINLYNRIKLMMKTISNLYYENHKKGIKQGTEVLQSENDEGETYLNDIENVSTLITINSRKIFLSFISDSICNPKILKSVCNTTKISFSKMTITINSMIKSRDELIETLIKKMLSYYYTTGGKTLKSTKFINSMIECYAVSNSSNKMILEIKDLLDKLMKKYSREYLETNNVSSLSNLKKTLFYYLIFYTVNVV